METILMLHKGQINKTTLKKNDLHFILVLLAWVSMTTGTPAMAQTDCQWSLPINNTDPGINYAGFDDIIEVDGGINGDAHLAFAYEATASFTIQGTGVGIYVWAYDFYQVFLVQVDNGPIHEVYVPESAAPQSVLAFEIVGLTEGSHTVLITMDDGELHFDGYDVLSCDAPSEPTEPTEPSPTPDYEPPTPNPAKFAMVPTADSDSAISMTAKVANDESGPVEYRFISTSKKLGGHNSPWQTSTSYTDTGLTADTRYCYKVKSRDNLGNMTMPSTNHCAFTLSTAPPADTTAPTPNPATFASMPNADSENAISMTATTATDPAGSVVYLFTETSGNPGGTNSGWQNSDNYTNNGLTAGTQYCYTVKTRDNLGNTTAASAQACATTNTVVTVDTTPPTPNPAKFGDDHHSTVDSMTITAQTANDPSGPVEYSFIEISDEDGSDPSGWQTSPVYTDLGLTMDSQYCYKVQTRDSLGNTTALSDKKCHKTQLGPDIYPPTPNPATFSYEPWPQSFSSIKMTADKGSDHHNVVEYYFSEISFNPGGSNSNWQTNPTYIDTGLTMGMSYCYNVTMRDGLGNTGTSSANLCTTTPFIFDIIAPTPNPATFQVPPTAENHNTIYMTATTATDDSLVEYFFQGISGGPELSDSGWQRQSDYMAESLKANTKYCYSVSVRDVMGNETSPSAEMCATTLKAPDKTAPTPNPATFAIAPKAVNETSISMRATPGSDASGHVEYFFDETSNNPGGSDSNLDDDPNYTDTGLLPDTEYCYNVQMHDAVGNKTSASVTACVKTKAMLDTKAPTPNPATFSKQPMAMGENTVNMIATMATDMSGFVEYYFEETSGNTGGTNSNWQTSINYSDMKLSASTQYCYRVQSRDLVGNKTAFSNTVCAITDAPANNGSCQVIINDNFENGLGLWNDGGMDCLKHTGDHVIDGIRSINLQDDTDTSELYSDPLDLTGFTSLTFEFSYKCISMDNPNEDFFLEISTDDGDSWTQLEEWNMGDEFVNGKIYHESLTVSNLTLGEKTLFRFRCDASGNGDDVYLDNIKITACGDSNGSDNSTTGQWQALINNDKGNYTLTGGNWYHFKDGFYSGAYYNDFFYTHHVNSTITYTFTGKKVRLYHYLDYAPQSFHVYIDGVLVDCIYDLTGDDQTTKVFESSLLSEGEHTIKIELIKGEILVDAIQTFN